MLKTIRKGDSGNIVKAAQYMFNQAARATADGNFSAALETTVKKWQDAHGLLADGIIGTKTWTALAKAMPTCSTSKNKTSAYTCAIQQLLGGVDVDGIFGSQTKKAVAAFQAANRLSADGIVGPKTWSALVTGTVVAEQSAAKTGFVQPVDYKQGDSRWGSKMYSSHGDKSQTMKNSACGPTSMADIIATWVDKSITPYDLAQLAMKWGDRTSSNGTAWSFFRHVQEHYKFKTMIQTTNLATLKTCLDNGGYAVASMGPGYWTSGGHFICLWKYDGTYIYANDPASSSRKKQKLSQFTKERKQYFCFYR